MENLYFKFTKIAAAMLHKLRNFIIEGYDLTVGWANKDLRLLKLSPRGLLRYLLLRTKLKNTNKKIKFD